MVLYYNYILFFTFFINTVFKIYLCVYLYCFCLQHSVSPCISSIFYLSFLPVMGTQLLLTSHRQCYDENPYTPLLGLCENFFGINLGAELPVIWMHTVYLLSIMARAVYTPTSNAGGFLYYTPHSMSANPWIYPYIWTHIFISSFRL